MDKPKEKKAKKILDEQFKLIFPDKETLTFLKDNTKKLIKEMNKRLKQKNIKASVFVGGSFAKGTIIKKDKYDLDLFVRFDSKYKEDKLSSLLLKVIPKKAERVHGSRDYFKLKIAENIEFEIIPTIKINNPKQARNITDLSYFHVKYVLGKIKKQKNLAKEIMLAKAFCHFNQVYGAESYIHGFSGYAVELLITKYKSLLNFMKAVINVEKDKLLLDPEKLYKNTTEIKMLMNESKMHSPIVLIDPTFKERNALASLSQETFNLFKQACKDFLKNPSPNFFKKEDKQKEFEQKRDVISLSVSSNRQAGDIAGTKLKKFYNLLLYEMNRFFDIKDSLFTYSEKDNQAKILISAKPKKEILFPGPPLAMKEQFERFKKMHPNYKIKNNKAYANEKGYKNFQEFLSIFQAKNEKPIEATDIKEISIKV